LFVISGRTVIFTEPLSDKHSPETVLLLNHVVEVRGDGWNSIPTEAEISVHEMLSADEDHWKA
jgi:hypothetical protein